jgi:hypothetical protein
MGLVDSQSILGISHSQSILGISLQVLALNEAALALACGTLNLSVLWRLESGGLARKDASPPPQKKKENRCQISSKNT